MEHFSQLSDVTEKCSPSVPEQMASRILLTVYKTLDSRKSENFIKIANKPEICKRNTRAVKIKDFTQLAALTKKIPISVQGKCNFVHRIEYT